jgi:hypothetical protein
LEPAEAGETAALRAPLSEAEWASAYREGQRLLLDEIVAQALAVLDEAAWVRESAQPEPILAPEPEARSDSEAPSAVRLEKRPPRTR